jgi:o-succinylbenzoate synthase
VVFGWEMAWLEWVNGGKKLICDLGFWSGNWAIPINGLVWMNGFDHMLAEARIKVAQGFDTIKIKVGSLAWKEEFELIQQLRTEFPPDKITIRIDANGSWNPTEALERLSELAPFSIHSVEQPIATGHWQEMAKLCQKSPIPVALDEELIGHFLDHQKYSLLESIPAAFLVLKPTLLGGLGQTHQWIKMAEEMDMDWWITSMLESNVGLNAIAQLAAQYHPSLPQGLGTGGLYSKNFPSPLIIENGELKVDKSLALEIQKLD